MPLTLEQLKDQWPRDFDDFFFERGQWKGRPLGVYQYINYIAGLLNHYNAALSEAIEREKVQVDKFEQSAAYYDEGFNAGLDAAKALLEAKK